MIPQISFSLESPQVAESEELVSGKTEHILKATLTKAKTPKERNYGL